MSPLPISRSADLHRLQDEGYAVEVRGTHLLVHEVPYVDTAQQIRRGTLVSTLDLVGDVTTEPQSHVVWFIGSAPCDQHGRPLNKIINNSSRYQLAADLAVDHMFSSKPRGRGHYEDYHEKMATYSAILAGPAAAIDPSATPLVFPVVTNEDLEASPFKYLDTASTRARINMITDRLKIPKVAIVGLGGTGVYILDYVVKTPVWEIHLFDGDRFLQHNAFRSPGAPSLEDLRAVPMKVDHHVATYSKMRNGLVSHPYHVDADNVDELREMDFVFVAVDHGAAKKVMVETMEAADVPFIDVGMGLYDAGGTLGGLLRVTTSTPEQRRHVYAKTRISFAEPGPDDEYAQNIQIAELNALNAGLAVIRWKKILGFYADLEQEHQTTYAIDGNELLNEDKPSHLALPDDGAA